MKQRRPSLHRTCCTATSTETMIMTFFFSRPNSSTYISDSVIHHNAILSDRRGNARLFSQITSNIKLENIKLEVIMRSDNLQLPNKYGH